MALIEVKLRPTGPWRAGHRTGDRERVDVIYHSDALYSALTHAMRVLGWLEPWLDATARAANPVVRFSSLYPFVGKTRLIASPRPFAVKLVPLELARGGAFDKTRWQADVPSQCMIPHGSQPPFQVSLRSAAAVDRITGIAAEPHRVACLEFAGNAGWWGVFDVTDSEWEAKIKAAFRLLADSGFGGERSRGWGRSSEPLFSTAAALFPDRTPNGDWWLLGLFSPAPEDSIDWTKSAPEITERGGWTDSPRGTGVKKLVRMIAEGSVLSAESLQGRAVDVAPEGFPHPVYRNGQPLTVPFPIPAPVPMQPTPEPAVEQFEPNPERDVTADPIAESETVAVTEEPVIELVTPVAPEEPIAELVAEQFEPNAEPEVGPVPVAEPESSEIIEEPVVEPVTPVAIEEPAVEQFEPNPEREVTADPIAESETVGVTEEPVIELVTPVAPEEPIAEPVAEQFEPNAKPEVGSEPVAKPESSEITEEPVIEPVTPAVTEEPAAERAGQFEPNPEPGAPAVPVVEIEALEITGEPVIEPVTPAATEKPAAERAGQFEPNPEPKSATRPDPEPADPEVTE